MSNTTVRALRGVTGTIAIAAALMVGTGAAGAAPLALEPAPAAAPSAPVAEEFTSSGSSTISSAVNAKVACLFQNTLSAMRWDC